LNGADQQKEEILHKQSEKKKNLMNLINLKKKMEKSKALQYVKNLDRNKEKEKARKRKL
jgi:hypothetical protein